MDEAERAKVEVVVVGVRPADTRLVEGILRVPLARDVGAA